MIECTDHQTALIYPNSWELLALSVSRKVDVFIIRCF